MRPFSLFKAVFITCSISLIFILCQKPALAQVTIGNLSAFKGEVEVVREGRSIRLRPNMLIVSKDRIKVEEGTAEVTFSAESTIRIRPHTDITLDQRKRKRKILGLWTKTYLSRLINIFKGKLTGIIKKRKDLVTEFETPALVAAVTGTTLNIEFDEETGTTRISSDVGVVDVFTKDGWMSLTLTGGQSVAVRLDRNEAGDVVGIIIVNTGTGDITVSTPEGDTTVTEVSRMTYLPLGEDAGPPGPAEPYELPERPGPEVPGEELPPGLEITLEPASAV